MPSGAVDGFRLGREQLAFGGHAAIIGRGRRAWGRNRRGWGDRGRSRVKATGECGVGQLKIAVGVLERDHLNGPGLVRSIPWRRSAVRIGEDGIGLVGESGLRSVLAAIVGRRGPGLGNDDPLLLIIGLRSNRSPGRTDRDNEHPDGKQHPNPPSPIRRRRQHNQQPLLPIHPRTMDV